MSPDKLDTQVIDTQCSVGIQLFESLPRLGGGWSANHALWLVTSHGVRLLVLLLLLMPPAAAQAQYIYTTNNGAITITGYTGSGGAVAIPYTINGLPVTVIGDGFDSVFTKNTGVTSVLVPDSVTSIANSAFYDCTTLTNLTIGNSVTNIGYAFLLPNDATIITALYFRGNAPTIPAGWLGGYQNYNTTAYYLPGTTGWATFINLARCSGVLWNPPVPYNYTTNKDMVTITITGYTGSGGAVAIPSTISFLPVTSIGSNSFYQCTSLTSATIPNSVTNIGYAAFYGCTSMSSITISTNVTNIADYTFYECGLTSVLIGINVTSIGNYAFASCFRLPSVTIPNNVTSIGNDAFDGCGSLSSVTISTNVTSIGYATFRNCYLTSVTIPNSITNIGDNAFDSCGILTSVLIGTNITSIGNYAFTGCGNLISVTIPNSTTNIGYGAFYACTSLTMITVNTGNPAYISVAGVLFDKSQTMLIQYPSRHSGTSYIIPNSVTNISDYAFYFCTSLTSVTLSSNATSIGYEAFADTSLNSITVPNSVTNIGGYAFVNCTSLTGVTIGTNVTSIGGGAFFGCSKLTNATVPKSVTSIGAEAFAGCTSLTSVTIPNGVTYIGGDTFDNCTSLTHVMIGANVTDMEEYVFDNCSSLTSMTIPSSITNIAYFVFANCSSLTRVFFMGNAPSIDSSVFAGDNKTTVYYLLGTTNWNTFSAITGIPVVLWNPLAQNFAVRTNQFGFTITGTANIPIVVEACTNLTSGVWSSLQTCTITNGSIYFNDPNWTNYPARFYRLRSP